MFTKRVAAALSGLVVAALAGCSVGSGPIEGSAGNSPTPPAAAGTSPPVTAGARPQGPAADVSPRQSPAAVASPQPRPRLPAVKRAGATRISLSIPAIGIRNLRVIPYTGEADDGPGTRIQNRGLAATPRGPRGGVAPGEIGNFIVTAHRTSAGGPMRRLPELRHGQHVLVTSGGVVYDYVVTGTMTISFRSAHDRARQSAPVPGHPGRRATRPMITLSTCATPEDRAAGNLWKDKFGNLEHRIDKIGVLHAVRPQAPA